MKYFYLCLEEGNFPDTAMIDINEKIDISLRKPGESYKLKKWTILHIRDRKDSFYPDMFPHPIPFISERLKEVIDIYLPEQEYRGVIFHAPEYDRIHLYYHPILRPVECLAKNLSNMKGEDHVVMYRDIVEKLVFFQVGNFLKNYLVVRLDLAESILRREIAGIAMKEADVVERRHGNDCV